MSHSMKYCPTLQALALAALALASLLVLQTEAFAQCAMCRETLNSDPDGERIRQGFSTGILFLGGMFFTLGLMVVVGLWRAARSFAPRIPTRLSA